MKKLIVNADDFGRSPGVNAGTLEAHERGIVTSATVMVLESLGRARDPGGGRARAADVARPAFRGDGRRLARRGRAGACRRWRPRAASADRRGPARADLPAGEIRAELEAQIGIFQVLARKPPTHLDSHHHAALHPAIAPVFAAVARARSLPVRASSDEARQSLRGAGVRTPDRFFDSFHAEQVSSRRSSGSSRPCPRGFPS